MKTFTYLLIYISFICSAARAQPNNELYQVSTISALSKGCYDGEASLSDLRKQGNFGLGTFNQLDGEMVCVDGSVYQIKSDGMVEVVADTAKTPFAAITNFKAEKQIHLKREINFLQLEAIIDSLLETKNLIAAIKITGRFKDIKARSVKSQKKPYIPLVDAVKEQSVFVFKDIEGQLVGFRFPDAMDGINVAGYHLHFLSADKKVGGHLINCIISDIQIEVQLISNFRMHLPTDKSYLNMNLTKASPSDIHKIEKQQ